MNSQRKQFSSPVVFFVFFPFICTSRPHNWPTINSGLIKCDYSYASPQNVYMLCNLSCCTVQGIPKPNAMVSQQHSCVFLLWGWITLCTLHQHNKYSLMCTVDQGYCVLSYEVYACFPCPIHYTLLFSDRITTENSKLCPDAATLQLTFFLALPWLPVSAHTSSASSGLASSTPILASKTARLHWPSHPLFSPLWYCIVKTVSHSLVVVLERTASFFFSV